MLDLPLPFSWTVVLTSIPVVGLLVAYLHFRLVSSRYWAVRNVPHLKPTFLLGSMWKANLFENFVLMLQRFHSENRHRKVLGIWMFTKPVLMITDLELVKRVLIRDFNYFRDRGMEFESDSDPLMAHLGMLSGKQWRNLRVKLTPTFTSGKMKIMFPTMQKCGEELLRHLKTIADNQKAVEVKDLLARFTTDVIASCAFGIETNSLQNPNSEFRKFGKKAFQANLRTILVNMIMTTYPKLLKTLSIKFIPQNVEDFFMNAVRDMIEYRERNNVVRNDFLQLLIQLMRAGKIEDVDKKYDPGLNDDALLQKFSLNEAAAQCFVFFVAGFETSSAVLTFTLYELARNPDIRNRLQQEIDEALIASGGKLSYDAMNAMEYLDMVVQESLRMYPPAGLLQRKCETNYRIPEIDVAIDKDVQVFVSVNGIHRDPDLYPDPERFDPERFTQEEKSKRHSMAFIPFGEGPRNCIGNRFALMQMKVALISILAKFNVEMSAKTPVRIVYDKKNFILAPIGGMPLMFSKRN